MSDERGEAMTENDDGATGDIWRTCAEPPPTGTPEDRMRSIVVRWRCGGFGIFPAGWFASAIHDAWAYVDDVFIKPGHRMVTREWRPIETAPQEQGSTVLGAWRTAGQEFVGIVSYLSRAEVDRIGDLCDLDYDMVGWWHYRSSVTQELVEPEFWMPYERPWTDHDSTP